MALKIAPVALALLVLACSKPDPPPRRTEPWLANPSASGGSPSHAPRRYRFTEESRIRFSVSGRRGKVSGHLALARGQLELDGREPTSSRATIDVDLTTIEIETALPESSELADSPRTLALQWLELGSRVPPERRAPFATARFELASVEGLDHWELGRGRKSAPARATAVGTLLLHGFRAPTRVEVVLSSLGPTRLSIRSASPFSVALDAHDVVARDASGVADSVATARAADWVGKSARVEVELFAELEAASK